MGDISFQSTGVAEIDAIISAIESASNGYHDSTMWDEKEPWSMSSPAQRIQAALDAAAHTMKSLRG